MVLAAHQPQFAPWLGYFDKMAKCDVFVLLDDVQFKKNEWQNRNRVKTAQGAVWLTVPVLYRFPETIREVKINNAVHWREKHRKTLEQSYARAACFAGFRGFLEQIYGRDWSGLAELNIFTVEKIKEILGLPARVEISSGLAVEGQGTARLVNLCRKLGADVYLSGSGGRDYLDMELFEKAGIAVRFQEFNHPVYPQAHGDFMAHLSIMDLLFNCGAESRKILGLK